MNSTSVVGCILAALILPMTIASAISHLKQEGVLRRANSPGADAAMVQRYHAAGGLAQRPCAADGTLPSVPHSAPYALSGSEDPASVAGPMARPGDGAQDARERLKLKIRSWWP
jgi:hypothetical protein